MAHRSYTVYLQGGASFVLRAARYERTDDGVTFYGDDDRPLPETFVDPKSVIAVIPSERPREGTFPVVG